LFSFSIGAADFLVAGGLTRLAVIFFLCTTLIASNGSGRIVTLKWSDNASNETGFYVERAAKAKSLQFSRIATAGANVTTYSQTEAAGTWVYRVQSFNGVGTSGYSNSATIRVR